MFTPNSLKYKGFYYNLDAFAMDVVNEFYYECARYIVSDDISVLQHQPKLTEKDNLPYKVMTDPNIGKRNTLDPIIVGFNLINNLTSKEANLNTSTFRMMGIFQSVNKKAVLNTFTDYKSADGKSATDLNSRLPLWIKADNVNRLYSDKDYIWDSFLMSLLFALENLYYSIKSAATAAEMKKMSFDKFLVYISPPVDALKEALKNVVFGDAITRPDYYNLPLICYQTVMQVFLAGKYSQDEFGDKIRVFTASIDNMLLHRLGQEFKQKTQINAMCALTARFLISELVSRGINPSKHLFENVLEVCKTSNAEDAALFMFANTTLAAAVGENSAVPYTSMRLMNSTQGKTEADKAYDVKQAEREVARTAAANAKKARDCADEIAKELDKRDKATAAASATAAARNVNVQNDAAATPGVLTTVPPTTATGGNTSTSGAVSRGTTGGATGASGAAGGTTNAGNAAANTPASFTPRTKRAMRLDKQSEWEGLDTTQLASYNKRIASEHFGRSKSDFDDHVMSLQPTASLTNHTAAIKRAPAELPMMNNRTPAASAKGVSRYKSKFGDKELIDIVYQ